MVSYLDMHKLLCLHPRMLIQRVLLRVECRLQLVHPASVLGATVDPGDEWIARAADLQGSPGAAAAISFELVAESPEPVAESTLPVYRVQLLEITVCF
jgi:hypothetical protein